MTNPIDKLKERYGNIQMHGVNSGDDYDLLCDDLVDCAEIYREINIRILKKMCQPGVFVEVPNLPASDKEVDSWVDSQATKLMGELK